MEGLIKAIKEMIDVAGMLSRQDFSLEFSSELERSKALALEYGTETNPPLHFIRLCEIENERKWSKLIDDLYCKAIDGKIEVEAAKDKIARQMEEDYQDYARMAGVGEDIVNSMYVEC